MKKIVIAIMFYTLVFSGLLLVGQIVVEDHKIKTTTIDLKKLTIKPNFDTMFTLNTNGKALVDKCFNDIDACSKNIILLNQINNSFKVEQSYYKQNKTFIESDFTILYKIVDKKGLIETGSPSLYYALLQWKGAWNRPVYGCFCGHENDKKKYPMCPIDYSDLDTACEAHDGCYTRIENTSEPQWKNCDPEFVAKLDVVMMKVEPQKGLYKSQDDFKQMQYIAKWARDLFMRHKESDSINTRKSSRSRHCKLDSDWL